MDSKTALAFALAALQALPALIKMTGEAAALIQDTVLTIKGMQAEERDPTPEEWDALNSRIDSLRAERDNLPE